MGLPATETTPQGHNDKAAHFADQPATENSLPTDEAILEVIKAKVRDPELMMNIVDLGLVYNIEVTAENRMVLLDQANGWRYTHEHQQQFFAGDNGLLLVPSTMTAEVIWGGRKAVPGVIGGIAGRLQLRRGE